MDRILTLSGVWDGTAVYLMDDMLSPLGSDKGGFLFLHIFLSQLPSPVLIALAHSPCLAAGDCSCEAEEVLATTLLVVQNVPSKSQQSVSRGRRSGYGGWSDCPEITWEWHLFFLPVQMACLFLLQTTV